ncbi:MAG: hypothetical protein ACKN89_07155 [Cyanobium sp.]
MLSVCSRLGRRGHRWPPYGINTTRRWNSQAPARPQSLASTAMAAVHWVALPWNSTLEVVLEAPLSCSLILSRWPLGIGSREAKTATLDPTTHCGLQEKKGG